MSLFESTFQKIKDNKFNLEVNKKPNCIPFDWFPKLKTVVPGIMRGTNIMVTAGTGVKIK